MTTFQHKSKILAIAIAVIGLSLSSTATAAGPTYTNFTTQPFAETNESCTGETVDVSGVIRHHVVFVEDATGGFHSNGIFTTIAKGISSSGTRYVLNFTDRLSQYFGPGELDEEGVPLGPPVIATDTFSFRLISNDGSPNLIMRATFHITINANGEVAALEKLRPLRMTSRSTVARCSS